jgi:hypothetical protein
LLHSPRCCRGGSTENATVAIATGRGRTEEEKATEEEQL